MALRLTDFGTYDEVNSVTYFTFTISEFSHLRENKISRAFRSAGHIWKLQVRKVNGLLGLFLRWYGGKIGPPLHIKCLCKTGIQFSVINHFDNSKTVTEGDLLEDDIYDRPGSGIGYGEVIELKYLDNIPGYLISDILVVQVKLKVKSTSFIDKLQITTRPDRVFVRGLNFSFHGSDWCLILFPSGEQGDSSSSSEGEEEESRKERDGEALAKGSNETEKATLYLSRESDTAKNPALRHQVRFLLFVLGGPCFEIMQNFHEKQSSVFGTGYLMSAKELQKLGSSGVVRVGVTFLDITPYFNFGYDLSDDEFEGITFADQRDIPWLLRISDSNKDEELLFCSIKLDPKSKSKRIKALATRDKKMKILWHVKIINFRDFEMSLDVWSEQNVHDRSGVFESPGEEHSVVLPIKKSQIESRDSPYLDDDGQSCVQISILTANFICNVTGIGMKIDEVAEISRYHNNETLEMKRDYELREQIWQLSVSSLEEEKNNMLNTSREELEKQENELKEKNFIINSLKEKLHSVEGYIQSLESNSTEEIDKFQKTSISKLIEASKPDENEVKTMDDLFATIRESLKGSSDDVVSVVASGSYGEGTLIRNQWELNIVVFVTGKLEDSMKNGNLRHCLEFIQNQLQSSNHEKSSDARNTFCNFAFSPISLKCQCGEIEVDVYPTKNWTKNGYRVIYEASTGLTKESLKCFITATAERRALFVRSQDEQCRDLIRLLNVWSDEVDWQDPKNRPSSYLLSLLAIHAYNLIKSSNICGAPTFCNEVLNEVAVLTDEKDFRIEWNDFYDLDEYKVDDTLPMVRDPALPSHNVAESAMEDWTQFREEITEWSASLCP